MHCIHTAQKQEHPRLRAAVFAQNEDPTSQVFGITHKPQAPAKWLCPCSWGWWPAVNYPTPCSCPGMKWDVTTQQLYRWLDGQQHNISQCAVLSDFCNLSFIYCYVKHKHSYVDLFQSVPMYVLWVKIILMKVLSWGWSPSTIHYNMWESTHTEHKICLIHFWCKCLHCVLHWTAILVLICCWPCILVIINFRFLLNAQYFISIVMFLCMFLMHCVHSTETSAPQTVHCCLPRMEIQQAKCLGSLTSHRHLTNGLCPLLLGVSSPSLTFQLYGHQKSLTQNQML
jgi:hypothetical protein